MIHSLPQVNPAQVCESDRQLTVAFLTLFVSLVGQMAHQES
jgi:hypothetical protein